jgi:3-methylcrotonyl-CoA carboxylase alpha subunit
MIAKLIVHDHDRDAALRRLQHALSEFRVIGLTTNLALLERLTRHPAFAAGEVDTGFMERHREALLPPPSAAPDRILALAALAEMLRIEASARALAARSADPWSPWHSAGGWRLNSDNHHTLILRDGGREIAVTAHFRPDHYRLDLPAGTVSASGSLDRAGQLRYALDGRIGSAAVLRDGHECLVLDGGDRFRLALHDPLTAGMDDEVVDGSLSAPMPGNVIALLVQPGDRVAAGDPLLVLEAMKMEHTLRAPGDGVVARIYCAVGEQVGEGVELLSIEAG